MTPDEQIQRDVDQEIAALEAKMIELERAYVFADQEEREAYDKYNRKAASITNMRHWPHELDRIRGEKLQAKFVAHDRMVEARQKLARLRSGEETQARIQREHDRQAEKARREEARMAGTPDPKNGTATKEKAAPKKEAAAKAPAEPKESYPPEIVERIAADVTAGTSYVNICKAFEAEAIPVPAGAKGHYNAIRNAAIAHFGSVEAAKEAAGKTKAAA